MTRAGTRAAAIKPPLTAPSTAPSAMPMSSTNGIGSPGNATSTEPVAKADSPRMEPTDRSTLRVMTTMA
jgi:hypothetical protein